MKNIVPYGIIFFLVACGSPSAPPTPENALPEKKFVEVMVDLHLIEAGINQNLTALSDTTASTYRYYKNLFEKHNIAQSDFDSTFNYYSRNPVLMSEIYTQVFDSLKVLSEDITENEGKYQKVEKATKDSLPAIDSLPILP